MTKKLKKFVFLKDDIFYCPTHNTFVRLEEILLEISGQEEKIFEFLICNSNRPISKQALTDEFPECSNPYDKIVDRLRREKIEGKLKLFGLIKKEKGQVMLYLSESPFETEDTPEPTPQALLCRESYYVDYDRILADFSAQKDSDTPQSVLYAWAEECKALQGYDEKCMLFLERLGFLPAFGSKEDKLWFIKEAHKIVYRFEQEDVRRYGSPDLLNAVRSLVLCVASYIQMQVNKGLLCVEPHDLTNDVQRLLHQIQAVTIPENMPVNPLILLVYYDYLGLIRYKNYQITKDRELLVSAAEAFEKAISYANRVDLHLQVWAAFLTFDLARVYSDLGDTERSFRNYDITISLRLCLVESPFFSDAVRHDLYFEYLLAKIYLVDTVKLHGRRSAEDARHEYMLIQEDMQENYGDDSRGGNQGVIRRMLADRLEALAQE